jgi:hypothetical protein
MRCKPTSLPRYGVKGRYSWLKGCPFGGLSGVTKPESGVKNGGVHPLRPWTLRKA